MKKFLLFISLFSCVFLFSQDAPKINSTLSYQEFIAYVKKHHPIIKQSNLVLSTGEAKLLKARGGFDPKLDVNFNTKEFKGIDYYDLFNATFKIPTWYGVEFKANFEENSGEFLNLQNDVPDEGLFAAGISVSVLEGFLINERIGSLKKARLFKEQKQAERDIIVNDLLLEASLAYFDWIKATNEQVIYDRFLENADMRFKAVKRNVEEGANAAIDSIEAKIIVQNRGLEIEVAQLNATKKRLKVSNYLWLNDLPVELQPTIKPELPQELLVASVNELETIVNQHFNIYEHPKVRSLASKVKSLEVDKKLKKNKLLPKLDLAYDFITPEPSNTSSFNTKEFKANINFSTPIFLRKERGDLKLAKYKLQDASLEQLNIQLKIQNKTSSNYAEISSLDKQYNLILEMVTNYEKLVSASERKFFLGESSLLAVNVYERKLIDIELKKNKTQIKLLDNRAKLFNTTGIMALFTNL